MGVGLRKAKATKDCENGGSKVSNFFFCVCPVNQDGYIRAKNGRQIFTKPFHHTLVCAHACTYECTHARMHACMHARTHTHTHTRIHTQAHIAEKMCPLTNIKVYIKHT